jgi:hypothetical protein
MPIKRYRCSTTGQRNVTPLQGFAGTPTTVDTGLTATEHNTASTTTVSVAGLSTNFANEATIFFMWGGGTYGTNSPYTQQSYAPYGLLQYEAEAASGTGVGISFTQASSNWSGVLASIYDAPGAAAPKAFGLLTGVGT